MREFIFYVLFSVLFFSCENPEEHIETFVDMNSLADEELKETNIYYTENGNIKVKVSAKKMSRFSGKEDIVELTGEVNFNFYRLEKSNEKSVLTCERATINNTSNIMIAEEKVVLIGTENKQLSTEQLIWDKNRNLIYTDLEVIITTEDEIISGIGFQSTPDFSEYEIKKAKGSFNLEKD